MGCGNSKLVPIIKRKMVDRGSSPIIIPKPLNLKKNDSLIVKEEPEILDKKQSESKPTEHTTREIIKRASRIQTLMKEKEKEVEKKLEFTLNQNSGSYTDSNSSGSDINVPLLFEDKKDHGSIPCHTPIMISPVSRQKRAKNDPKTSIAGLAAFSHRSRGKNGTIDKRIILPSLSSKFSSRRDSIKERFVEDYKIDEQRSVHSSKDHKFRQQNYTRNHKISGSEMSWFTLKPNSDSMRMNTNSVGDNHSKCLTSHITPNTNKTDNQNRNFKTFKKYSRFANTPKNPEVRSLVGGRKNTKKVSKEKIKQISNFAHGKKTFLKSVSLKSKGIPRMQS